MNTLITKKTLWSHCFHLLFALTLFLLFFLSLGRRADAVTNLSPNPLGRIPYWYIDPGNPDALQYCDFSVFALAGFSAAYAQWVSVEGQGAVQDVQVNYGQTTPIRLQFNHAQAQCLSANGQNPPAGSRDQFVAESLAVIRNVSGNFAAYGMPNIVPGSTGAYVNLGMAGQYAGTYGQSASSFQIIPPPGGFRQSGMYTFNIGVSVTQMTYRLGFGPIQYDCVNPLFQNVTQITGLSDINRCHAWPAEFSIYVLVRNPPVVNVTAVCEQTSSVFNARLRFSISASDPDGNLSEAYAIARGGWYGQGSYAIDAPYNESGSVFGRARDSTDQSTTVTVNYTCPPPPQFPPVVSITAVCVAQNSFTFARLTVTVTASDPNNNIVSVSGVANGQSFGNGTTVLNVPYNQPGTAVVTVTDSTNLSTSASANYTCPRPPIPGCMDRAAANYNPLAELDDGSCIYDFCLNIPDVQPRVPDGLFRSGMNCYFPTPTCSTGGAINVLTGEGFTTSFTIRNASSADLDITRISYSGPAGIAGTPNGGSPDLAGNGQLTVSGSHTLILPTRGAIGWVASYAQPYGLGNGSITCSQDLSVRNRPPVCTVLQFDPAQPLAGQRFRTRVRVGNPNPGPITMNSANYELRNTTGVVVNGTGSAEGIPGNIGANGSVEFQTAQNIRVLDTSYNINAFWTVVSGDESTTCEMPVDQRINIILLPPTCTIISQNVVVGLAFTTAVSIQNANQYAPIDILDNGTFVRLSNGIQSGARSTDRSQGWVSGVLTLPEAGVMSLENTGSPELIFTTAGDHSADWIVNSEAGRAIGDCRSTVSAYTRPYVRFYGNDIFSGGAYGDTCSITSTPTAQAVGIFSGAPSHATYRGSAAELAVFALGNIEGVLPGAQNGSRTALNTLAFANTSTPSPSSFGGNFTNPLCADDYWAERPRDALPVPVTQTHPTTTLGILNLSDLASGSYYSSAPIHVVTSQANQIANGRRITIYVDGDVWLGDNNFSGNSEQRISYSSTSWGSVAEIPILRIVALGNIFVDNNIVQLDGQYIAVSDPADSNTGQIHTCALSDNGTNLKPSLLDGVQTGRNCTRQLVVNGSFVAQKVHLLRLNGNIATPTPGPEPASSNNIAEVFRFSPELYLSLAGSGTGAASAEFDGVQTLPPAL